jgi:hypothetical protein
MTQIQRQDLTEVESLLATRQQLAEWLEKLEGAGNKAPSVVRDRVRSDYQTRLGEVVAKLGGHSDAISAALDALRGQARDFAGRRAAEQETLAEAELRYEVGEYSPEEWGRVEQESSGRIHELTTEIDRLGGEIGRLEEVLSLVSPGPLAGSRMSGVDLPSARPTSAPPAPRSEPAVSREPAPPPAPTEPLEAPRFVPRGGLKTRDSGPVKTIPFPVLAPRETPAPSSVDEMTFLKSVSLEGGRGIGSGSATVGSPTDNRGDRQTQTIAKTLKCSDCGSLNRPTEWYCERCGAELAAV